MPDFNPLAATGLLNLAREGQPEAFLGTCFGFGNPSYFLTAAHTLGEATPAELVVVLPIPEQRRLVVEVHRHPSADVAALCAPHESVVEPFWNFVGNYSLGEDFFAYGYPESVFDDDATRPTPRLFRGHYQRFLEYQSRHLPYRYMAGEMSIPSPVGLSGGPIFRPAATVIVTGLVTENLESWSGIRTVEEVKSGDRVEITKEAHVISYGVGLMLDEVAEWLTEAIPSLASGELAAIRGAVLPG